MHTWIVAHSETLCNFLIPLLIGFSDAQKRHALNFIEAILICPSKHKTLATLTRWLRLDHADEYALADFFRRSPWEAGPVQQAVTVFLLRVVSQIQAKTGWRLLFLSIDDSLCQKDVATSALEAVGLHYDHVTQRRQQGKCTNGSRYVSLHLQFGPVQFTLAWRLYLKRNQVKQLNRERRGQGRPVLKYCKLVTLVEDMLDEIAPEIPTNCRVYVLFDAWYDNHHLLKFIRAHGWHWICATRSNRRLSRYGLTQWWAHLGHQRLEHVSVRSATRRHTYHTRHLVGRLRRYPDPVIAIISKRDRRDHTPAYFLCSDLSLSVRCILKYYSYRWQAEVDNWWLKERLGLADYRLQSVEAILNWHALVFAAYAFLQYQRVLPLLTDPQATLQPLGEVLATHQRWHARQTVHHIARLIWQGMSLAELVAALVPT
jgi:hypothetical protein